MRCKDCEYFLSDICIEDAFDCYVKPEDEACSLFRLKVKPFLTGYTRFESKGKEIVIIPIHKGRDLI